MSGIGRKEAAFMELTAPDSCETFRSGVERTVTLNLGNGSVDLYQEMNMELLWTC